MIIAYLSHGCRNVCLVAVRLLLRDIISRTVNDLANNLNRLRFFFIQSEIPKKVPALVKLLTEKGLLVDLKEENEGAKIARLYLVGIVKEIIVEGCGLLGIQCPEKM